MSGLYLERKEGLKRRHWLMIASIPLIIAIGWFGYSWFTTGEKPPLVPVPAAALADTSVDETPLTQQQIDNYKVDADKPRYITIPALGVEKARVQSVGLNEAKQIDTPANISDTAWYDESALPGQGFGVVVINGHNGGITRNGVFAGLDRLKLDDEIIIERGDGKKLTYKVVENRTETLEEANKTGLKRLMEPYDTSKEGLGLITCAGNWIPRDKVFDKRVLLRAVLTTPVEEQKV